MLHAPKENKLLYFDFLSTGCWRGEHQFVLVLEDYLSSSCKRHPATYLTKECAVICLLDYFFKLSMVLTTDSGRRQQFKSISMYNIHKILHGHHHFSTTHCPQWNDTVQVDCTGAFVAMLSLLFEPIIGLAKHSFYYSLKSALLITLYHLSKKNQISLHFLTARRLYPKNRFTTKILCADSARRDYHLPGPFHLFSCRKG